MEENLDGGGYGLMLFRELNDPFYDARSWRTLKESPEVISRILHNGHC
jgi:hypothetical protein